MNSEKLPTEQKTIEKLSLDEGSKEVLKKHVMKLEFSSGIAGFVTETVIVQSPSLSPEYLDAIKNRITEIILPHVKNVSRGEAVDSPERLVQEVLKEFGAEIIKVPKVEILYEHHTGQGELGAR